MLLTVGDLKAPSLAHYHEAHLIFAGLAASAAAAAMRLMRALSPVI